MIFMYLYLHMDAFIRHPRRPSTKFPRNETPGDEVYPQRNGWRQSVPATKCLARKCTRDETAGNKVFSQQNGWRRNGSDKTAATKRQRRNSGDERACTQDWQQAGSTQFSPSQYCDSAITKEIGIANADYVQLSSHLENINHVYKGLVALATECASNAHSMHINHVHTANEKNQTGSNAHWANSLLVD